MRLPENASLIWKGDKRLNKRGVARKLLRALLEVARYAGCRHAWVLTDRSNLAAMRLYASAGGTEAQEDAAMFSFVLDEL